MDFQIGQIFTGEYPVEAAQYCNESGCFIEELEPLDDVRRYIIKAVSIVLSVQDYDVAMERYLFNTRAERGYTTREPTEYLTSAVPRWQQDARDWVAFRDQVLVYALGVQNEVEGGGEPPTLEAFLAGMPAISWTYTGEE